MSCQSTGLREALAAFIAGERFLTRVDSQMYFEVVGSAKAFAAFTTNVSFLAGVDSLMSLQSREGVESFVA